MQPALKSGQLIIGRRTTILKAGTIVVIRHQGLEKIKRVNRVRDGKVFVLGDNPAASTDSRQFGWIDKNSVQAAVIWPRQRHLL